MIKRWVNIIPLGIVRYWLRHIVPTSISVNDKQAKGIRISNEEWFILRTDEPFPITDDYYQRLWDRTTPYSLSTLTILALMVHPFLCLRMLKFAAFALVHEHVDIEGSTPLNKEGMGDADK